MKINARTVAGVHTHTHTHTHTCIILNNKNKIKYKCEIDNKEACIKNTG